MSGELVGMVVQNGPQDHYAWAVAVVIAEDMHHAGDTALFSLSGLAARTRLSVSSVQRGLRHLRKDGWVQCAPGNGRGNANRYRLLVDRFPQPKKAGPTDLLSSEKAGPTDLLSDLNLVPQTGKLVPQTIPTVSVTTPSSSAREKAGPTDLLSDEDDELHPDQMGFWPRPADQPSGIQAALDPLPWCPRTPAILAAVQRQLEAGHTPYYIGRYLDINVNVEACRNVSAVVLGLLDAMAPPTRPQMIPRLPSLPREEPTPMPDYVRAQRAATPTRRSRPTIDRDRDRASAERLAALRAAADQAPPAANG